MKLFKIRRYRGKHRCNHGRPPTCLAHHSHDWDSAGYMGLVGEAVPAWADMCIRDCSICGACPTGEHETQAAS